MISWHLGYFKKTGAEFITGFEERKGAGSAIAAGRLETAWIEEENLPLIMTDRSVGMAVDHTVGLGKEVPDRIFNIRSELCAMGEADGEPVEGEQEPFRMMPFDIAIAHIAMNSIDGLAVKGLQNRQIGKVAGMDDDIAGLKALFDLLLKTTVWSDQVRVCKYSRSD